MLTICVTGCRYVTSTEYLRCVFKERNVFMSDFLRSSEYLFLFMKNANIGKKVT